MSSPTTYRAEIPDTSKPLNRGRILTLGDNRAGSNPRNPIAAGMGMTLNVRGSSTTVDVAGVMRYDMDPTNATSKSIAFTKSTTQENVWTAQGAVGGAALGFPDYLDYDTPQPFTLVMTVTDRSGTTSESHTFWVGSAGDHAGENSCLTRTTFSALLQNCCFNGQGYRASTTLFGVLGPYDFFFDPGTYAWAVGIEYLTNGVLTKQCNPNRDLLNPYIPDSISGVVSNPAQPDNPFTQPTVTTTTPNVPFDVVGAAQRVRETIDGAASQLALQVVPTAAPPRDPDGFGFVTPPGYQALSPASYPAPAPPFSRATGAARGTLSALFPDQPAGEQHWFDRSAGGRMQITLSGMQAGETAYFFISGSVADFSGEPDATANPNGYEKWISGPPLLMNRIDTANVVVQPLVTRLHAPDTGFGALAGFIGEYAPYAITGGSTWSQTTLGGVATIGTNQTSLTFAVPIDVAAFNQLTILPIQLLAGVQELPGYSVTLVLQAIVCRPGTGPTGTLTTGSFGVDWPQSSYLTNPVFLRMRD